MAACERLHHRPGADDGFIPQVGYRPAYFQGGYTLRPKKAFLSRIRIFTVDYLDVEPGGDELNRLLSVGAGMDGRWSSFYRIEMNHDQIRVGTRVLDRFRPRFYAEASPTRVLNFVSFDAYLGEEIDFDNAREGHGATLLASFTLHPGPHLELRANANRRWLNVDDGGASGRLFTADVERLRGTWAFDSRSFVRVIGQYVQTRRDHRRSIP